MVDGRHAEGFGLLLHVAPDTAHAQDPEHLALGVVAEGRGWVAAPCPLTQGHHARVEVAECAQHEEDGRVGGGVVRRRGHVRHQQRRIARRACHRVDLVVPRAAVGEIPPGLWQGVAQLRVKEARDADRAKRSIRGNHAVQLAVLTFLDEVRAVCRLGRDQVA